MKLQFKHQKFQSDAAKAVVDVFAGQPYMASPYLMDKGTGNYQITLTESENEMGWANAKIVPSLTDRIILGHINEIQKNNKIALSDKLEGKYNLTVEMETGVGKTYTYIKTMYELNRQYGWSKYIVIVPSIAIREGVYKSLQVTQDHFTEEYGKKIRFFIYNSSRLTEIEQFASDSEIHVMIINSQAFNAKGKDARRIYMKLDSFRSRRPIDMIAKTNPIIIIDEPQSVEGKRTKESLKAFNPLITLRYSATHKSDSIYNMVYRLDALEAYNKRLVKKIAVKGISEIGTTATDSYVYLESIHLSKAAPMATIQFDCKGPSGIRKKSKRVSVGSNLYNDSGRLSEYENGYVVKDIDGRDNSIEFVNGIKIYAGDIIGRVTEEQLRRIQIRETILSHIERERQLFHRGIKVLSLFFIDEVSHYKEYDLAGEMQKGIYARMFEEEYQDIIEDMQVEGGDIEYMKYLNSILPSCTHAGYFSIDKKGRLVNRIAGDDKSGKISNDADAYDLIMRNKELLLERDPEKSPVRFLFSHSALREGWDNPNVFQICTLKQSSSDVRKRQEVGRGLRLCVNQNGERMDWNALGSDVHNVNVLTVIANESYDSFSRGLQMEIAETIVDRPMRVKQELFVDHIVKDDKGNDFFITSDVASIIHFGLIMNGYVNKFGELTEKYYCDRRDHAIKVADEVEEYAAGIIEIIDSVYDHNKMRPENARNKNIELQVDQEKLKSREFEKLWSFINSKSAYTVDFDTDELISKSIHSLNSKLKVSQIYFKVELGQMREIKSKEDLQKGTSMSKDISVNYSDHCRELVNHRMKYDLVGRLVEETGLVRKTIIEILCGIKKSVFDQFKDNPEDFIIKAAFLINEQKAAVIVEHVTYNELEEKHDLGIFTHSAIKGRLGVNAIKVNKHLYDYVVYDSVNEKKFAETLDIADEVAIYVKLPDGFYISTPVGRYTPDWAIAFRESSAIKNVCFVAETKGSMSSLQMRLIEEAKIHCAKEHFKAIGHGNIVYDVVNNFDTLMQKVMSL